MYNEEILEKFANVPVFSLSDVSQIVPNREYAKKVIQRLVEKKKIIRVKKDLYTRHKDAFLVATYLYRPSYISGASALSYHHMTTQLPHEIFCMTSKVTRKYAFVEKIMFHHTKHFFGFEAEEYLGFKIQVASPEKAIIDSIGHTPLAAIEDAFDEIDAKRMLAYIKKIKKSSIAKRMGYLLESYGHDVFPELKGLLNKKYLFLDPLAKNKNKKNKKWGLIL